MQPPTIQHSRLGTRTTQPMPVRGDPESLQVGEDFSLSVFFSRKPQVGRNVDAFDDIRTVLRLDMQVLKKGVTSSVWIPI